MGKQTGSNPNTFEMNKGSLYLVGEDGIPVKKGSGFTIVNGLDWNSKADKVYFTDSLSYQLYQYYFDNTNGSIKAQLVKAVDMPDDMTVDEEGYLWVAVYGTSKIIRINPKTGENVFEVIIPKAHELTSVTFGGADLDILFVTVGRVDWSEDLQQQYPESGRLFMVQGLGVKGTKSRDCSLDKKLWETITS